MPETEYRIPEDYTSRMAEELAGPQSLNLVKGDVLLINCDEWGISLYQKLAKICEDRGVELRLAYNGTQNIPEELVNLQNRIAEGAFDEGSSELAAEVENIAGVHLNEGANKVIALRGFPPLDLKANGISDHVNELYENAAQKNRELRGPKDWIVVLIPTPEEARIIGLSYEEYLEMFFKAIDRDYETVYTEQSRAIEKLRKGKKLEITQHNPDAPEGWQDTYLEIDIEDHFRDGIVNWANSTIRRNMPGSEIFTAPNNVNGVFTVFGPISFAREVLKGMKWVIKDNEIDLDQLEILIEGGDQDSAEYARILKEVKAELTKDEGARFIGELGIGTNPVIQGSQINAVLAEKKLGFHLAAGDSYEIYNEKPYADGVWVHVDNGIRSAHHYDLPSANYEGLTIKLDGEQFMVNGVFVNPDGTPDPQLAYISASTAI